MSLILLRRILKLVILRRFQFACPGVLEPPALALVKMPVLSMVSIRQPSIRTSSKRVSFTSSASMKIPIAPVSLAWSDWPTIPLM
ncbi:MAG: hypothetical protein CEE38_05110 [Planctomycetes bacterium B3_Pla]|nr:MAG: hypothetical protein CEE38_05110 [Planctomycetes bacterium B3_Pla]